MSADSGVSADLRASGISIRDQFVSGADVLALRECARTRELRGDFAPARIGRQGAERRRDHIRGDFTCWLSEPLLRAERLLMRRLEELRLQMNRDAFLGLFELELHYARYPAGAAYSRHVDQPMGSTQRKVSLVLYLNQDWQPTDGGILRIHITDDQFVDVEPIAGRLVCFLTPGREHEVLQAQCERLSISGWFRGREN
ncbi:MAG TPA: 2OG-Fe(II) oxygenase [Steroidobacteraceae bacterium]|nr:2OG-Fe(II) oxygenase [Steroidobacteraceae bacterium]